MDTFTLSNSAGGDLCGVHHAIDCTEWLSYHSVSCVQFLDAYYLRQHRSLCYRMHFCVFVCPISKKTGQIWTEFCVSVDIGQVRGLLILSTPLHDLYYVEWDVKFLYTIPYHIIAPHFREKAPPVGTNCIPLDNIFSSTRLTRLARTQSVFSSNVMCKA